jgi:hypothetical protein
MMEGNSSRVCGSTTESLSCLVSLLVGSKEEVLLGEKVEQQFLFMAGKLNVGKFNGLVFEEFQEISEKGFQNGDVVVNIGVSFEDWDFGFDHDRVALRFNSIGLLRSIFRQFGVHGVNLAGKVFWNLF